MAQENVVVVRLSDPSKAYQALSVLKECDAAGRIGLESAAVVQRGPEGELSIPESADNVGLGTASGSLIGMLVGMLGGPVGVLLGWGAGALMGGAFVSIAPSLRTRRSRFSGARFRRSRRP
jgi:uncharacterized membrane protein